MNENEFDFENRIISTEYHASDADVELSLRPRTLDEYIGQQKAKENQRKQHNKMQQRMRLKNVLYNEVK